MQYVRKYAVGIIFEKRSSSSHVLHQRAFSPTNTLVGIRARIFLKQTLKRIKSPNGKIYVKFKMQILRIGADFEINEPEISSEVVVLYYLSLCPCLLVPCFCLRSYCARISTRHATFSRQNRYIDYIYLPRTTYCSQHGL